METKQGRGAVDGDLKKMLSLALGGSPPAEAIRADMTLGGDLGLDSVAYIGLVLDIEDCLQRKIFSSVNLGGIRTVGDLLDAVEASTPSFKE